MDGTEGKVILPSLVSDCNRGTLAAFLGHLLGLLFGFVETLGIDVFTDRRDRNGY
jgi:uncharacterized membrane protein required for colicin V production